MKRLLSVLLILALLLTMAVSLTACAAETLGGVFESSLFQQVMSVLIPAVVAGVGAVLAVLWKWIREKTKSAALDKYLDRANDAILTAVAEIMQTFVSEMKKAGTWDKEAAAKAFEMARLQALDVMGAAALKALPEIVGDVEKWITAKIEAATLRLKTAA